MKTLDKTQKGFTLGEAIVTVGVIGILAGIAIPSYLDYLIKPAITEAEFQMDAIIKGFQEGQTCGDNLIPDEGHNYVRKITISKPDPADTIIVCKIFVYFSESAFSQQCNEDLNCNRACPNNGNNCYLEYHFKVPEPGDEFFYSPMNIGWLDFFIPPSYAVTAGGLIAKSSTVAPKYWPKS
jgi:Tfp pilus assembly major pilin PilA